MRKDLKVCYGREFLLSLAHSDPCKKLPSEFDSSISCELSDPCAGLLQPTCDSDSGILHFKTRQSLWQNPEKGLLGQGSFPGKPGCMVGVSSPKVQGSGFHLLSRSVAPYRPPHLSKIYLLSQMESKGINDGKLFGSTDCPYMEKVDEERKIRESFELTRRGEKAFQEEHGQKEYLDLDITTLSVDSANDKKLSEKCSQSDKTETSSPSALAAGISVRGNAGNLEDISVRDCHEKSDGIDEICLPDEDSLITVEDFIVPRDTLSTADIFGPVTPVENFRKLAAPNPYHSPNAGQLSPHFRQPHRDPGRDLFHALQSKAAAGNPEVQSLDTKISHHFAPHFAFSTTAHSGPLQNFYDPFVHTSQQQTQLPGEFPITQSTGPTQTPDFLFSQPFSRDLKTPYLLQPWWK